MSDCTVNMYGYIPKDKAYEALFGLVERIFDTPSWIDRATMPRDLTINIYETDKYDDQVVFNFGVSLRNIKKLARLGIYVGESPIKPTTEDQSDE